MLIFFRLLFFSSKAGKKNLFSSLTRVLHDGLLGRDQRVRVVRVAVDVAVDDEVVGEHRADQGKTGERRLEGGEKE